MRSVIVDGIDCAGKSTLIQELKFRLKKHGGYDIKALEHKDGDQFKRYISEYISADRVLFDRGHFSEIVFSKILRGKSAFSEEEEKVLNLIANNYFIVILATPEYSDFVERFRKTKDVQVIKEEDFELINSSFISACSGTEALIYRSKSTTELKSLVDTVVYQLTEGS